MPLGFIGFSHVADFATLVVNAGLLILQPLARLCAQWVYVGYVMRCCGAYCHTPGVRSEDVPSEMANHA